ncbi:hypothetical protein D3C86_2264430 [compost metagenome]
MLQGQEAVIETVGRHHGAQYHDYKNQLLDVGENRFAEFSLGLGEQDHAGRIEQGGQQ